MKRMMKTIIASVAMVALSMTAFAQEAEVTDAVAEDAVVVEEVTEAVETPAPVVTAPAETPATNGGLQTVFSQIFADTKIKEIEIDLISEDFVLATTGSDTFSLEIRTNVRDTIPTVVQDGKSLKVTQKNKKAKTAERSCVVVLTLPQNYPPAEFELSLVDGQATLEPLAAGSIEIEAGNGVVEAKQLRADKKLSLEVDKGTLTVKQLETKTLSASAKRGKLTIGDVETQEFAISVDKGTADIVLSKPFKKASSLNVGAGTLNLGLPAKMVLFDSVVAGKGRYRSEFPSDTTGPMLKGKIGKGSVTVTKR